jgi:5-methylcytosine-specific restriction endonuclease McrA
MGPGSPLLPPEEQAPVTLSEYKRCARCGQVFPRTAEFFSPCRNYFQSYCKPNGCEKAFFHDLYVLRRDREIAEGTRKPKVPLTPERRREQALAYYYRHRDKILAKARVRYADPIQRAKVLNKQAEAQRQHPERRAAARKRWEAKNLVRRAGYAATRRARQAGARTEARVSYVGVLRDHGRWCHICDKPILLDQKLTFDHVIPLSRGGAHCRLNLAPAHASCNFSKGDRILFYLRLPGDG